MRTEPNLGGRIAILGSGREGLAAFDYITALGTADDLHLITEGLSGRGREPELQSSGILKVGPFEQAGLDQYDVLVRSPGVSPYRASLQSAVEAGVRMTTPSTLWFQAHADANTILISGTKGKSTTAALLAHLLEQSGVSVRLAGNIGMPLLACDERGVSWWVIELSSYQIADLQARAKIGVLLNLASDHLDWHGGEAQYRADKLRLADLVEEGGLLANASDPLLREAFAGREGVNWFSSAPEGGASDEGGEISMPPSLPGKHNRSNLHACIAVLRKLGMDTDRALQGLDTFKGLPHRLQSVGEAGGVRYVDDSISSAPVATVAALEAFSKERVVLLLGGLDRGIDWAPYAEAIRSHPPAAVIALPDNGQRIVAALEKAGLEPELGTFVVSNLAEAVETARRIALEGAVILLSPGAPSFPHFRDYEDRGRQFAQLCQAGRDDFQ